MQQAFHWIREALSLPKLTPATDLGAVTVAAYARRAGVDVGEHIRAWAPPTNPSRWASTSPTSPRQPITAPGAYLLTPEGLKEISQ